MNKKRRDKISAIATKLNDCKSELESIKEEEDDARDNMPENLEGSSRYSDSEEASDAMDSAITDIESAVNALEGIA